jgi:transposase
MGRPPRDTTEPDWQLISREMKRKSVTLLLLWQEYREAHPDGFGYTWFCDKFGAHEKRANPAYRHRHSAGAEMQTDYAGQTIPLIDPDTGEVHAAQLFVAVLGASSYTFAVASLHQQLPDWIDGQVRALEYFGGTPGSIVCDNLKAGVAKALWFEPTLTATFAAMAEHYDTTVLPTRPAKPRDKGKVEGAVLIVERWIIARLRNQQFFDLGVLNAEIAKLLEMLNGKIMRHVGRSRREMFEEIERATLRPLPVERFEYAEWKTAKVHPDYHVAVDRNFYSVPHGLIGKKVDVRLTQRVVEIFHDHKRVASHMRSSQRGFHITVNAHMPKAHQRYADRTPASLIERAARMGTNVQILVERMMSDRRHPEQGYRSAMGIVSMPPVIAPWRSRPSHTPRCSRSSNRGSIRPVRSRNPTGPPHRTATSAVRSTTNERKERSCLHTPCWTRCRRWGSPEWRAPIASLPISREAKASAAMNGSG